MSKADMQTILVTGANGWIGRALSVELLRRGHAVCGLVRQPGTVAQGVQEWVQAKPDFANLDETLLARYRFDAVVHTAARAHVMNEHEADPLACYRATNVTGTRRIAEATRRCGIPRFVFLSSIKALGETEPGRPWRETDSPDEQSLDAYGRSKHEAEQLLLNMPDASFHPVVVRPPLVYGPGVRANFLKLIELIDRARPLPLGCATAPRSLVALGNLVDALIRCATVPPADSRQHASVFHVADAQTLSVRELVLKIGSLLGKKPLLWPIPVAGLRLAGRLSGRSAQIDRLTLPLRTETDAIRVALNWAPPLTADSGLEQTIAWYRSIKP